MSLTAQYVDGKLVTTTNTSTAKTETTTAGSSDLDKDAFLQLLVAQMKYQDPLEPTSNTEYISQYATFSELEQMQNMSSNMTLSRASEAVGKEVIIESQTSSGDTVTVQGYVEKVVYNGTKAYLSIDGSLYSIDDLKQVLDDEYSVGTTAVEQINKILGNLPSVERVTLNDVSNIADAYNLYTGLTDYQKTLLTKEAENSLVQYVNKASELMEVALDKAEGNSELDEDTLDALLKDQDAEEI